MLRGGGERAPGGLPGLQNQWGCESAPAGSIPVRLRHGSGQTSGRRLMAAACSGDGPGSFGAGDGPVVGFFSEAVGEP